MGNVFTSFDDLGCFIDLKKLYLLKLGLQACSLDFNLSDDEFSIVFKTHAVLSGLPSLVEKCSSWYLYIEDGFLCLKFVFCFGD